MCVNALNVPHAHRRTFTHIAPLAPIRVFPNIVDLPQISPHGGITKWLVTAISFSISMVMTELFQNLFEYLLSAESLNTLYYTNVAFEQIIGIWKSVIIVYSNITLVQHCIFNYPNIFPKQTEIIEESLPHDHF